MTNSLSDAEARVALHEVERGRERVIDQIGMPAWYWWGSRRAGSRSEFSATSRTRG